MSDYISEAEASKAYTEIQRNIEDDGLPGGLPKRAYGRWLRRLTERVLKLFRRSDQVSESGDAKSFPRSLSSIFNCIRKKASAKVAPSSNETYESDYEEVSSCETLQCSSESSKDFLQESESSVSIPDPKGDCNEDHKIFSQAITIIDDETRTAVEELKSFQSPEADGSPEGEDLGNYDREGAMSRQSQYSDELQLTYGSSLEENSRKESNTDEENELEELISRIPQTVVLSDLISIRDTARSTMDRTDQALRRWATICEKPFPSAAHFTKAQVINLVSRRTECRTGKYLRDMNSLLARFDELTEVIEKTAESQQRMSEMRRLPVKNGCKKVRFGPRADTPPIIQPRKSERLLAEQYVDSYKSGDNVMIHKRVRSESLVHRMIAIEEEEDILEEGGEPDVV